MVLLARSSRCCRRSGCCGAGGGCDEDGVCRARRWSRPSLVLGVEHVRAAQERYALIVSGASGGPPYAEQYARMGRRSLARAARADEVRRRRNVVVLEEAGQRGRPVDRRERAPRAWARSAPRMTPSDLLLVVLIGHGTFDGADAKFNLVGPDLESAEWAALFNGLAGSSRHRQHRVRGVPVPGAARRAAPSRDFGDRQRRAALRHRLPGVLHSRVRGSGRRHRQERPRLDLGSVRGHDRVRPPLLPAARDSSRPSGRCSTTTATASATSR